MAHWHEGQDDTHGAREDDYTLKVWKSKQYGTWGWTIGKAHIIKAGDARTLEDARKAAEAAIEAHSEG